MELQLIWMFFWGARMTHWEKLLVRSLRLPFWYVPWDCVFATRLPGISGSVDSIRTSAIYDFM